MNQVLSIVNIFPIKIKLNFPLKIFWIISFILMIALSVLYVFQINAFVSESYQIQNYQKAAAELSETNKALEINSARINSLEDIETKVRELGFEKIEEINYIQIKGSSVASK